VFFFFFFKKPEIQIFKIYKIGKKKILDQKSK